MKQKALLILIIILAVFLRLSFLSSIPPALNWDEASVGYNAYSILKTGSDEYSNRFPLTIRSFNDFKPSPYTYSVVPAMAIFGRNEFAVRLPSALAGILTVLATYFLVKGLTNNRQLSILSSFFLAISPWHLQFSRIAFEASLALMFFVAGAAFLVRYLNRPWRWSLALSLIFFVFSTYTHHSVKLIMPIFLLLVGFYFRKVFLKHRLDLGIAAVIALILLFPLVRNMLRPSGQVSRFATVSIFSGPNSFHNQGLSIPVLLGKNYLSHLDPRFLFLGIGDNPRHHAPNSGVLLFWSLPFILVGLGKLIKKRPRWTGIILIWFVLAPLAAIFSIDSPHASRSFLYLPIYEILTAVGLVAIIRHFQISTKVLTIILVAAFCLNFLYFIKQYFLILPKNFAPAWQYGYKQLVQELKSREKNYDRIYITTAYDQPYIYFLFYGQFNPLQKNDGTFSEKINKYQFVNLKNWTARDFSQLNKNTLVVLPADEIPEGLKTLETINYPNGPVAFRLMARDN